MTTESRNAESHNNGQQAFQFRDNHANSSKHRQRTDDVLEPHRTPRQFRQMTINGLWVAAVAALTVIIRSGLDTEGNVQNPGRSPPVLVWWCREALERCPGLAYSTLTPITNIG